MVRLLNIVALCIHPYQIAGGFIIGTTLLGGFPSVPSFCLNSDFVIRLRGGEGASWKVIAPVHVTGPPRLNTIFPVSGLKDAGLGAIDESVMFARQEALDLWTFLDVCPRRSHVTGSPGSGKSTMAWAWFCHECLGNGKNGLWIHAFSDFGVFQMVRVENGIVKTSTGPISEIDTIKTISESSKFDFVIFDGYQCTLLSHVKLRDFLWAKASSAYELIVVSCLPGNMNIETRMLFPNDFGYFTLYPWTIEQYKTSCRNREFFRSVRGYFTESDRQAPKLGDMAHSNTSEECSDEFISDLIDRKYYVAGVSARWMFSFSEDQVLEIIEYWLNNNIDDANILLSGARDGDIAQSRGYQHLMAYYKNGNFFVSQTAARKAFARSAKAAILTAYRKAAIHNDYAFLGWVAEFDFIAQLQAASDSQPEFRKIMIRDGDGNSLFWDVPAVAEYNAECITSTALTSINGHWLRPKHWNQAGFDLLRLHVGADHLIVIDLIQVTRAQSHDLNLRHFSQIADEVDSLLKASSGHEGDGGDLVKNRLYGVNILVVTPLDVNGVYKRPTLNITELGMLGTYHIGDSQMLWPPETESRHIQYFSFTPAASPEMQLQKKRPRTANKAASAASPDSQAKVNILC